MNKCDTCKNKDFKGNEYGYNPCLNCFVVGGGQIYLNYEPQEIKKARTEPKGKRKSNCFDCGMPYGGKDWIDTVLPNEQWKLICPENQILCANCIVKRASKIKGVIITKMKLVYADGYNPKTQYDRIRNMSVEEMAKLINRRCPPDAICDNQTCIQCWTNWLNSKPE